MESAPTPRRSRTADAMRRSLVERAKARSAEERILLALQLGERGRMIGARLIVDRREPG